jgi:hypothetical protein
VLNTGYARQSNTYSPVPNVICIMQFKPQAPAAPLNSLADVLQLQQQGEQQQGEQQQGGGHQQAYDALQSAQGALADAKKAVLTAAAASSGDQARDKAAKELAKPQQDAAELQLELAKVWVLCCNDSVRLEGAGRNFFDLPQQSMQTFKPFGM